MVNIALIPFQIDSSAKLFSILFYKQALGLNLLIFETFFVIFLFITKQLKFSSKLQIICITGFLLTAAFTVLTHSTFSYIIHFITLLVFVGFLSYPFAKSIINIFFISIISIFQSQIEFFKRVTNSKVKGKSLGKAIWKFRIFIIPAVIIFVFVAIYKASNPIFNKLTINLGSIFKSVMDVIFSDIEFLFVLTFLFGIFISNILLFRTKNPSIEKDDTNAKDLLIRYKKKNLRNFGKARKKINLFP